MGIDSQYGQIYFGVVRGVIMRTVLVILFVIFLLGCASMPPAGSLTIATVSLPTATAGQIYTQQFTATGGIAPYTWTITSGTIPNGLALSDVGVLSGIPTMSGNFSFVIQVSDSNMSSAQIQIRGKIHENS